MSLRRIALIVCVLLGLSLPTAAQDFVRGDCNVDANADLGDPIFLLAVLFAGGGPPDCADSCDVNDDGGIDISDAIYHLGFLFAAGPDPFSPFPDCGSDSTTDALGCDVFAICVTPVEDCTNGVDDDGDGFVDCDDFDCDVDPACAVEDCTNGVDDDGDGFIDCADFDCSADPACNISYDLDIQPIWENNFCTNCHSGPGAGGGMDLTAGISYGNIVDVPSNCGSLDRIEPFDLQLSHLWRKINGTQDAGCGSDMPTPLPFELDLIEAWILNGANP